MKRLIDSLTSKTRWIFDVVIQTICTLLFIAFALGIVGGALSILNTEAFAVLIFIVVACVYFTSNWFRVTVLRYSSSPFVLLLGSFKRDLDDEAVSTEVKFDREKPFNVESKVFDKYIRAAETVLLPSKLALGLPVLRIGGLHHKYVAVLKVKDEYWYDSFKLLSACARVIIIIPGHTDGIARELTAIGGDPKLSEKTLFFQPPAFEMTDSNIGEIVRYRSLTFWKRDIDVWPESGRHAAWSDLRNKLKDLGFELPTFQEDGQLIPLDRARPVVALDSHKMKELIGSFADAQPVSKALRQLSEINNLG